MSYKFEKLFKELNINYNTFIRTSNIDHKESVKSFWNKLKENNFIYLDKYKGWYSISDESFYKESDLIEGKAPTGSPVEFIEEESYFFALSKFQNKLLDFFNQNPDFIFPKERQNEVIKFIKSGLKDLSISRTSCDWGVKVNENSNHTVYVWLDALVSYLSAAGFNKNNTKFLKTWPVNIHIIGKDILKFHAVYWLAFLMATELNLPKKIISHGWWTNKGQKISKSLQNTIDPIEIIKKTGTDPLRYFLSREINLGNDGDYSYEKLVDRYNQEIVGKIGNLLHRTITLAYNTNKQIPKISKEQLDLIYKNGLMNQVKKTIINIQNHIQQHKINEILNSIILISDQGNKYFNDKAPWKAKSEKEFDEVIYATLESVRYIGILLQPIIPYSAKLMLNQLFIPNEERMIKHLSQKHSIKAKKIEKPSPIFKKLEYDIS